MITRHCRSCDGLNTTHINAMNTNCLFCGADMRKAPAQQEQGSNTLGDFLGLVFFLAACFILYVVLP